jgi:hypothetical protein
MPAEDIDEAVLTNQMSKSDFVDLARDWAPMKEVDEDDDALEL